MLILKKEDIKKILSMKEAIQASKEALSLYSSGKSVVPLRVVIDTNKQGQSLFMPAYIEQLHTTGIKIVSVYPTNVTLNKPSISAKMLLLDGNTGEVIAMMDGTYLTQLRTGALQGAATDILARKNAKIAALFGTGGQAATQLEAMMSVRDLTEVRVFDINFDRALQFASTMKKELAQYATHIVAVKDSSDAIKDADIITTVTTSEKPVFDGSLVNSGTHINGIGAYMPHMQEIPALIVQKSDKIIFDTNAGVLAEAGDIIIPLKSGVISQKDFNGELGEVILNKVKGRETEQEITLFKAVGSAVLDVVTAHHIYVNALENKIGQHIEI
jgi:ornithine cyclodeaminase